MELNIEHSGEIGAGNFPDFLQFHDTVGQQFFVKSGEIFGKASLKIDNGRFDDITWLEENNVSPDKNVSLLEIKTLSGFGVVGSYLTPTAQKMIIYEFQYDMSKYLSSGSIKHSIDNPISSFTLTLENPVDEETEIEGPVVMNEKSTLLSPGAKIIFKFGMGDDFEEYEMGTFYVDRTNYTVTSETVNISGRNLIGKTLKDQTLDEKHEFWYNLNTEILRELLRGANIPSNKIIIEPSSIKNSYKFTPNNTVFNAVEEVLSNMIGWQIKELEDGTIVIGDKNFVSFTRTGQYVFNRNKDIFSRQILSDDIDTYGRICVHSKDFIYTTYRQVETYSEWNLQTKKTLYVQAAEGSSISLINEYADLLAEQMKNVGKIESFTGPFRPHLTCGDEAIITDGTDKSLGLITEIEHIAGKQGFYTNFTVDSGGKLGKGRISDFIKKISGSMVGAGVKVGNSDIQGEESINLAPLATKTQKVDSSYYFDRQNDLSRLTDGSMERYYGDYGSFSNEITFDFGQRVLLDKLIFYDGDGYGYPQRGYKWRIWNSEFWVTVIEQDGLEGEMNSGNYEEWNARVYEHILDTPIECSKIMLVIPNGRYYIKEVEIFGKM